LVVAALQHLVVRAVLIVLDHFGHDDQLTAAGKGDAGLGRNDRLLVVQVDRGGQTSVANIVSPGTVVT
jgi:hypothetical protein